MASLSISDEELMAYADGELEPARAEAVANAVDQDPEIATRLRRFTETRLLLGRLARTDVSTLVPVSTLHGLPGPMAEPRPPHAAARDRQQADDNVLPFKTPPRSPLRSIAASLALVLAMGGVFIAGRWSAAPDLQTEMAELALGRPAGALATILSATPAGEAGMWAGREVRLVASFRDHDGNLCREFETARNGGPGAVAISCRTGDAWNTRLIVAAPDTQSYGPASASETAEAFIQSVGGGDVLSADEEKAALAQ